MQSALRRALVVFACSVAHAAWAAGADDAAVRASAGILMSRGMDTKDRVAAADSLARYFPRAAVPVLIEALNETSEPVRRAAARGLWTIARADNPDDAAAARAATPALRIALSDVSVSVAMNAAEALERLGEPASALAESRRKALRAPPPFAYERFLAARGLIGIDPAPALAPYVLDFLFAEHRRLDSQDSSGARENIRVANAALARLVQTGDRGVLVVLEGELNADRPGTSDLLRALAIAKPAPDHFVRTLVIASDASRAETAATAYEIMAKMDDPASLSEWAPAAARALGGPAPAGGGRACIEERRRQDAGRHARACPPRGKQRARSRARGRARHARGRQRRDEQSSRRRAGRGQARGAAGVPVGACARARRAPVRCGAARLALHRA